MIDNSANTIPFIELSVCKYEVDIPCLGEVDIFHVFPNQFISDVFGGKSNHSFAAKRHGKSCD